ncbi:ferredoxin reductase [Actinomadura parmotrematis]|uniref:Ferredoxin reductase n=1 Tax=Actinomadura parmotrematis TaxID=2864039 RepID=A0ABS7G2E4_9ACTN|nr:ferredoxin reductase [Actinomadura parmotrematis]MBW8486890.1 ferredoxin reductase [Actinomadura parmotrematis]
MARAAVRGRLTWTAARLAAVRDETASARTLTFAVPDWPGHLPGQHVDVRLTAEDGYVAERSYSLASAEGVELTIQRVPDGEVSPYLADVLEVGDEIELRGPVGGWFVWRGGTGPVVLVGGGSGIVPLMAMVRAHRAAGGAAPFHLLYSVRTPRDVYYAAELAEPRPGLEVTLLYTREAPPGHARPPGRIGPDDLAGLARPADCFVCGPTGFVEATSTLLVDLGHDPRRIRTERFGPTGA